jgi:hypothetical protein
MASFVTRHADGPGKGREPRAARWRNDRGAAAHLHIAVCLVSDFVSTRRRIVTELVYKSQIG